MSLYNAHQVPQRHMEAPKMHGLVLQIQPTRICVSANSGGGMISERAELDEKHTHRVTVRSAHAQGIRRVLEVFDRADFCTNSLQHHLEVGINGTTPPSSKVLRIHARSQNSPIFSVEIQMERRKRDIGYFGRGVQLQGRPALFPVRVVRKRWWPAHSSNRSRLLIEYVKVNIPV